MKTYKDLRAVAHAWAYADPSESGKNSTQSFWFSGNELYSYHTVIAERVQTKLGEICLINYGSYSVSTSKHQGLARSAVNCRMVVGAWEEANRGHDVLHRENIIKSYTWKAEKEAANLASAKRESTRERYTNNLKIAAFNLKELITYGILKKSDLTPQLKKLLLIESDPAALEKMKLAGEKELKKKLKAKKAEIEKSINFFTEGGRSFISQDARQFLKSDLIRAEKLLYKNEVTEIRTSQGVLVPLKDALYLYAIAKKTKDSKVERIFDGLNKPKMAGKYPVDKISSNGDCKVGCHFFKFEEIERCYKKEYLPTLKN